MLLFCGKTYKMRGEICHPFVDHAVSRGLLTRCAGTKKNDNLHRARLISYSIISQKKTNQTDFLLTGTLILWLVLYHHPPQFLRPHCLPGFAGKRPQLQHRVGLAHFSNQFVWQCCTSLGAVWRILVEQIERHSSMHMALFVYSQGFG